MENIQKCLCGKWLPIYDNDLCVTCYEEGVEEDMTEGVSEAVDQEGNS